MSDEDYKVVESYSAAQNAWYNTQIEYDKSILTLATAGLGFVIALLNTFGVSSTEGLVLNMLAILSFVVSMATVLIIFKKNGEYLRKRLIPQEQLNGSSSNDTFLGVLDTTAAISFALGVVFSSILAVSVALNSYRLTKEKIVTEKNQQSKITDLRESFKGAPLEKKSFNGAPIVNTSTETTTTTTQSTVNTQNTNSNTKK